MATATTTAPLVTSVLIKDLVVSDLNPRKEKKLDPIELEQLAASIRSNGILQPLVVRRAGGKVEVLAGRRRLEAAKLAGLDAVPCVERELDDRAAASAAVVENEQRAQLRPLDSALAVARRLAAGESVDQVSVALGKPAGWVARRANLTKLAPAVRKQLEDPESELRLWPLQTLELFALLPEDEQKQFTDRMAHAGAPTRAALLQRLARSSTRLSAAPWKLDDAELVPKAGPCSTCPHNSANCQDLFGDLVLDEKKATGSVCRLASCWQEKLKAVSAAAATEARKKYGKSLLLVRGDRTPDGALNVEDPLEPKNVINEYSYQRVKESASGSKPALIVSGKGLGGVIHIKMNGGDATRGERAKAAAAPKPEPGSKAAVKASTERLERKRMGWLVDEIRQRIEKTPAPKAELVMKLASMFGVAGDGGEHCGTSMLKKMFAAASAEKVWEHLRAASLTDPLIRAHAPALEGQHELAIWLGQLLFADSEMAKLTAAAIEAVPAPKSLGGLKQTKAKPAAAKAKKPATAKKKTGRKA